MIGRVVLAAALLGVCGCTWVCVGVGCAPVEQEVRSNSLLDRMQRSGSRSGVATPSGDTTRGGGAVPLQLTPPREVLEDGTIVLHSRNPRELIKHVYETLGAEERDLFIEQVLSERTKLRFYDEGYEPGEAFDRLRARFEDVRALLSRMPGGEVSPDAHLSVIGRNQFRLSLVGRARADLVWTSVDMAIEGGSWRLVWFGRR